MAPAVSLAWALAPFAWFGSLFPLRYQERDDHFVLIAAIAVSVAIAGPVALLIDGAAITLGIATLGLRAFITRIDRDATIAARRADIARLGVTTIALFSAVLVGHALYRGIFNGTYPVDLAHPVPAAKAAFYGIVGTAVSLTIRLGFHRFVRGSFPKRQRESFESLAVPYLTPYVACTALVAACIAIFHPSHWWMSWLGFFWVIPIHFLALFDIRQRHAAELLRRDSIRQAQYVAIGEVSARVLHQSRHQVGLIGWSIHRLRTALESPGPFDHATIDYELDALSTAKEQLTQMLAQELAPRESSDHVAQDDAQSLVTLATRVMHALQTKADARGITLKHECAEASDLLVAPSLFDAIFNVVDNAIDAARSHVTAVVTASPDECCIEIRDDGDGLTISTQQAFEPFATSKTSGSGMGLAIAEAIVSDLHGSITVRRENNETTFSIVIHSP